MLKSVAASLIDQLACHNVKIQDKPFFILIILGSVSLKTIIYLPQMIISLKRRLRSYCDLDFSITQIVFKTRVGVFYAIHTRNG